MRRGFRIYPSLYVMIAVMFAVQHGHEDRLSAAWKPLLAELTFFQDYLRGLWNHTWSLAIEVRSALCSSRRKHRSCTRLGSCA